VNQAERDARDQRAVALILAGATYAAVAKEVPGYANRGVCWNAIQKFLARPDMEGTADLRAVEAARLDRLQAAHWPAALRGDAKASVMVVRVMERRARLLGLDVTGPAAGGTQKVEADPIDDLAAARAARIAKTAL
jgi:hypothetical protein